LPPPPIIRKIVEKEVKKEYIHHYYVYHGREEEPLKTSVTTYRTWKEYVDVGFIRLEHISTEVKEEKN